MGLLQLFTVGCLPMAGADVVVLALVAVLQTVTARKGTSNATTGIGFAPAAIDSNSCCDMVP